MTATAEPDIADAFRELPHDINAERVVLGLAVAHPDFLDKLDLTGSDFYRPKHEWLWTELKRLRAAGAAFGPAAVNAALMRDPREYNRHGGAPYLFELHQQANTEGPAGADFLASVIRNHARRRQILQLGQRLVQTGSTADPADLVALAVDMVDELARAELFGPQASTGPSLPPLTRLDTFLEIPDEAITYRADPVWPTGGRVVLSAQHKAGKTTMVGNLTRSLADGTPFLDTYRVQQANRIILIDNELDERMLRRWLRDHGVHEQGRVEVLPLRGKLSTFNILDKATRTHWAQHIGRADVLIFDCLRPALDSLGLSEDKDAGRFLEALDELTTEAGIPETLLVHHMGHTNERSRGDSRILDWPDAVWKLVRDAETDGAAASSIPRYFSAYGRDVDVPQSLLGFDPITRHLHIAGGSRADRKIDSAITDLLDLIADTPMLSGRAIEEALTNKTDHTQADIRAALKRAIASGQVTRVDGPRRSKLHTLKDPQCVSALECVDSALTQ